MKTSALTGELVYLAAYDVEKGATATARWIQDSEYTRLADSEPARLSTPNQIRKFIEEEMADAIIFSIYTLAEEKLLGDIGLGGIDWSAGSAWVGIAIPFFSANNRTASGKSIRSCCITKEIIFPPE